MKYILLERLWSKSKLLLEYQSVVRFTSILSFTLKFNQSKTLQKNLKSQFCNYKINPKITNTILNNRILAIYENCHLYKNIWKIIFVNHIFVVFKNYYS